MCCSINLVALVPRVLVTVSHFYLALYLQASLAAYPCRHYSDGGLMALPANIELE
jgi:hypothetical protein